MNTEARVIPIRPDEDFVWLPAKEARLYFWNQKKNIQGISIGTMMNQIYSCRLNGRVKYDDYKGWLVKIPADVIKPKAA